MKVLVLTTEELGIFWSANKNMKVLISTVSLWGMSIKKSLGRLSFPSNLIQVLESEGFEMLPMNGIEAISIAELPLIHQDPFDRMLIMQAKINDLVLITRDAKIIKYSNLNGVCLS